MEDGQERGGDANDDDCDGGGEILEHGRGLLQDNGDDEAAAALETKDDQCGPVPALEEAIDDAVRARLCDGHNLLAAVHRNERRGNEERAERELHVAEPDGDVRALQDLLNIHTRKA